MATYSELRALFNHRDLQNKVQVACIIAAEAIRGESDQTANHANRLTWAKATFANPDAMAERILMSILAAYKTSTTATILGASDSAIQTAVDAAVNLFADGA